ncbi:hypothetical protein AX15_000374 [Amanita polypyramis BW_CC]|nr:hypothetical protein AX15_000374 [Amanita polypyramis BW_CC]
MLASVVAAVVAIVLAAVYGAQHSNNLFVGTRLPSKVLLLTAHPDDECLFFAPTVLALTQRATDDLDVFSLTLSTGNADSLGEVRKQELHGSLDTLGVKPDRRWIVDHPQLQDNITQYWAADVIADVLRPYVFQHKIDTILTFDHQGISSHPNHKSLPDGVKHLIHSYDGMPSVHPPQLFSLVTVPLLTKYNSILSPLRAKFDLSTRRMLHILQMIGVPMTSESGKFDHIADKTRLTMPVFVSGFNEFWRAVQAMGCHRSQLVWFRYLYVLFSRYMWVNEWVEIHPSP